MTGPSDWQNRQPRIVPSYGVHRVFSATTSAMASSRTMPSPGPRIRRGTGQLLPLEFVPLPGMLPESLFSVCNIDDRRLRFVHTRDPSKFLVFTDGACFGNGGPYARAGWAFVYGPQCKISGRLENRGPFGDQAAQTNNRAEMRAVLAALRSRNWLGEGCRTLVIATDSKYVVKGATEWIREWIRNDWTLRNREKVQNRDMWEALLGQVEEAQQHGLMVELWWIRRELNEMADAAAGEAAEQDDVQHFADVVW